jgi:uncharacterized membrane protein YsdA (DUF1294 family)
VLTHESRQARSWLIFDVWQKPVKRQASGVRSSRKRLGWQAIATLAVLLITPGFAFARMMRGLDWWLFLIAPLAMSIFAFFAYRSDKRSAEVGEWRVPEFTLHVISLLGGWPGAFLAQRVFRHKTSKLSFQFVFWCVVAMHQYLALDSLIDWQLSSDAFRFIREKFA